MQKYCWRKRDPHVLCSRLNEMCWLASVAEYSFTGIATNPNEIVKLPIDLAAIAVSPPLGLTAIQRSKVKVKGQKLSLRHQFLIVVDLRDAPASHTRQRF